MGTLTSHAQLKSKRPALFRAGACVQALTCSVHEQEVLENAEKEENEPSHLSTSTELSVDAILAHAHLFTHLLRGPSSYTHTRARDVLRNATQLKSLHTIVLNLHNISQRYVQCSTMSY